MASSASAPQMPPDDDRGPMLLAVAWALTALSTFVFAARIYVRRHYTRKLGADDYWVGVTALLSVVFTALVTVDVMNGYGRHIEYAMQISSPETLVLLGLWTMILGAVETLTIKLSITSYLLRLRPGFRYKVVVWAAIVINVIVIVLGFIVCLTQCQPLSKMWNPTEPGTCWPEAVMVDSFYTICAVCALTWVVYIVLPIFYMWNLQLPAYTKRAIWALLGLGLIPSVCSMLNVAYVIDMTNPDTTWAQVNFYIIFLIEINSGIIVASIPPMKPLIDTHWPGLLTSTKKSSSGSSKGSFGRIMSKVTGSNGKTTPAGKSFGSTTDESNKDCTVTIDIGPESREHLRTADTESSCIVVEHHISVESESNKSSSSDGESEKHGDWKPTSMV